MQGELCRLPCAHRLKNLEAPHLNLLPWKLEQKIAPKIFHLTAFTGVLGEPGGGLLTVLTGTALCANLAFLTLKWKEGGIIRNVRRQIVQAVL